MVHYSCHQRSVNGEKYAEFLKDLRKQLGSKKVTLFIDNLGVHKSPLAKEAYRAVNFDVIFNVPYHP